MRTWRVGLIGCGFAAEHHLPALRSLANVRVAAVADIVPERARTLAAQFSVDHWYDDAAPLLRDPAVDVVAILTPPDTHAPLGLATVAAHKPFLIEKPLGHDLDTAYRLARDTESAGVPATIAFSLRFHRLVSESRARLARGELGRIAALHTTAGSPANLSASHRRQRESGGGSIIELGVHVYDLWRHLLGTEAVEVAAMSHTENGCEDVHATVSARFAGGELATTVLTLGGSGHDLHITGSGGRLVADLYRFDGLRLETGAGDPPTRRLVRAAAALACLPTAMADRRWGGVFLSMFRCQWQSFLDALEKRIPPGPTLADGLRAQEIAAAAVEAAQSGRSVRLDGHRR